MVGISGVIAWDVPAGLPWMHTYSSMGSLTTLGCSNGSTLDAHLQQYGFADHLGVFQQVYLGCTLTAVWVHWPPWAVSAGLLWMHTYSSMGLPATLGCSSRSTLDAHLQQCGFAGHLGVFQRVYFGCTLTAVWVCRPPWGVPAGLLWMHTYSSMGLPATLGCSSGSTLDAHLQQYGFAGHLGVFQRVYFGCTLTAVWVRWPPWGVPAGLLWMHTYSSMGLPATMGVSAGLLWMHTYSSMGLPATLGCSSGSTLDAHLQQYGFASHLGVFQ